MIRLRAVGIEKIAFSTNDRKSNIRRLFAPYINKRTYCYEIIPCKENVGILMDRIDDIEDGKLKEDLILLSSNLDAPQELYVGEKNLSTLRDYQIEDFNKLINLKAGANFSEQRTGKTPVGIMILKNLGKKSIIICPSSIQLMTWEPQLKQFAKETPIMMYKKDINNKGVIKYKAMSQKERLEQYKLFFSLVGLHFLVVSKDTLKLDLAMILENIPMEKDAFNLLIDEAHFFKAHKSKNKTTKQCKAILDLRKFADRVYALTGTPSANHPSDIFGILHLLHPARFKSYYDFIEYFWGFDNFKNVSDRWLLDSGEVWLTNILKEYSVMRKQVEVMDWLPEIIKERVEIPMTAKQAEKYYNAMVYFKNTDDEPIESILTQIGTLRQISNAYVEDDKYMGSGKIDWLKDYMKSNPDEKLLILSGFSNKTIPYVAAELEEFNCGVITGATHKQVMRETIEAVQKDEVKHLISNIAVVKEGITLDKIDTIVFFDRMFNPNDNAQVESRFIPTKAEHSRGKIKQIIDLVSINPVDVSKFTDKELVRRLDRTLDDKKILELLDNKIDITDYINRLGKDYDNLMEA